MKKYRVREEDRQMLLDLYNRGGFHTGYYHTQNGREMIFKPSEPCRSAGSKGTC